MPDLPIYLYVLIAVLAAAALGSGVAVIYVKYLEPEQQAPEPLDFTDRVEEAEERRAA